MAGGTFDRSGRTAVEYAHFTYVRQNIHCMHIYNSTCVQSNTELAKGKTDKFDKTII